MAKLDSLLQFTGSIGNLSFYKTQDGYIARRKYGPSARRIKTDPAYVRTRENNAEFARAGKATRLIRSSFAPLLPTMSDNRVTGRLTRELLKVIKLDVRNARGERTVMDGNVSLLSGFDFNAHSKLSGSFPVRINVSIDTAGHGASIEVPGFIPSETLTRPEGATHFRLTSAAAVINFARNTSVTTSAGTGLLALESSPESAFHHDHSLPSTIEGPVFVVLGIEFFQMVSGGFYPLKNTTSNAMAIVAVGRIAVMA